MTSVARRHDDSGEYSDGSQEIEPNNSENEAGPGESDYESQGSDSERSDRDPESQGQEAERPVDHDEDRSNPQYIPKRGTFYEHDDRTAASGEESANTTSDLSIEKKEGSESGTERRRPPRKSDVINKWSHDKFNENEQMPKSREELVAIYGYDIRNEDAPPHARRNRRYGRGPNKYTRTWEDEEAYKRQTAAQQPPRKPPTAEDFPHLDAANNRHSRKPRAPRPRSKSQPNRSNESIPSENGSLRRNASIKTTKKPLVKNASVKPAATKTPVKPAPKREDKKMPPIENLTITANVSGSSPGQPRRVAAVAQQLPVPSHHDYKHTQPQPQSNPPQNKPPSQQQPPPKQQQSQQQPAGGEPRGGSKRYSSLRQRPLAENYTPQQQQKQPQQQPQLPQQQTQLPQQQQQLPQQQQPLPQQQQPLPQQQPQLPQQQAQLPQQQAQLPQQQHRYNAASGTEFTPTSAPHPQHIIHQQVHLPAAHASPPLQHAPQQHNQQQQQQQRLLMEQQQQLVAHHTMHSLPPPHGQLPPAQGYAPQPMMPTQYMPTSARGGGAVYGGVYAPAPPYAHQHAQMYTHHNYASQAGGVTYFSCAEQEQPPRQPRRPTAAIPIVRPQQNLRSPNSSEKDNIDRIVENMFVRKPWPATHGDSKDKSSSERSSQEPSTKDQSQPNSLTSSSISTDSKPSETKEIEETEDKRDEPKENSDQTEVQELHGAQEVQITQGNQESITTDA